MITLYTTNCPQCRMLEQALEKKHMSFDIVYGEEPIVQMGLQSAPVLKVDDDIMPFAEAVRWINAQAPKETT